MAARSGKEQHVTVAGVVAYAAKLCEEADRIAAEDPYANPYRPTEAAARKLCQTKARELAESLPPEATDAQREAEAARGPERARVELAWRAARRERERREAAKESQRRDERHGRRQSQAGRERERAARARGLTVGQRIDAGLAQLSAVAAAPASRAPGDQVSGSGDRQPVPVFRGDPVARGRAAAQGALREIEREVDRVLYSPAIRVAREDGARAA